MAELVAHSRRFQALHDATGSELQRSMVHVTPPGSTNCPDVAPAGSTTMG